MPMYDPNAGSFLNMQDLYGAEGAASIRELVDTFAATGGAQSIHFKYAINTATPLYLMVEHVYLSHTPAQKADDYGNHAYELSVFLPGTDAPIWSAVFRTIGRLNAYLKSAPGVGEWLGYADYKPGYWRWKPATFEQELPIEMREYSRRLREYDERFIEVR